MNYLFTLINLGLIFFIADSMAAAFYDYYAGKLVKPAPLSITKQRASVADKKIHRSQSHYRKVTQRDLFKTGKAKRPPAKPIPQKKPPPGANAKITGLKLELKGTITGTGSDPAAIIKAKGDRKGKLYQEGDTVDRARIKTILRGKVVLLVDGKEELLVMKASKSKRAGRSAAGGGDIEDLIQLSGNQVNEMKSQIADLRRQVRVRPHYFKGKMDGFRITSIKNDSVFYKTLGLRNGDIISAVDDHELKSIADVARIYSMFSNADGDVAADVQIKRYGKSKTIRYSIQ
ncbi:type II secretion system protein N [Desulfobacter latus]|uniref:Type II secretion system protein GspC N-terminal domain-containing protein n=1 Tax=Desulfobacter latus TaxID=2292 RepID=A0A850SZV2_9BACT|nr:type II secretion system protein N [Desulfobacter latus]NWH05640.1 hypothetical protein [Desulfobacter latus]